MPLKELSRPQPKDALSQTITNYNKEQEKKQLSPETITAFWQAFLDKKELNVAVPACNWTTEEIRRPMVDISHREINATMMVPKVLFIEYIDLNRLKQGRSTLILVDPAMGLPFRTELPIAERVTPAGKLMEENKDKWIKTEATVNAPNRNTTEYQLKEFAKEQGYLLQELDTYTLASQANHALTGAYFDGLTWSRLLSYFPDDRSMAVRLGASGNLHINRWPSYYGRPLLGCRFIEVKKG